MPSPQKNVKPRDEKNPRRDAFDVEANREHLRYASPDFNTGYGHDARRALPRDFVPSSNYEQSFEGVGPRSFRRSDERIREEVCELLARHRAIDARDIDVEVKGGHVTLSGFVPDRRMRYLAEDVAEHCFGVTDISNNIRVRKQGETKAETKKESKAGKGH